MTRQVLRTNGTVFSNFIFVFELLTENRKIFKLIARCEYWSKCKKLYINGFFSTSFTYKWKSFSKFQNCFRKIGQKNIQKDREASILIKILCIIHHFIWLYELYYKISIIAIFYEKSRITIFLIVALGIYSWVEGRHMCWYSSLNFVV